MICKKVTSSHGYGRRAINPFSSYEDPDKIYVTIYTKEKGRCELTPKDWANTDLTSGTLHREDGPAVIYNDDNWRWYYNGLLHREDGPAVCSQGIRGWYIHGKEVTEIEKLIEPITKLIEPITKLIEWIKK